MEEPCLALRPARRSELLDQLRRLRASDDPENMAPARGRTPHLCPSDFAVTVSDVTPRVSPRSDSDDQ